MTIRGALLAGFLALAALPYVPPVGGQQPPPLVIEWSPRAATAGTPVTFTVRVRPPAGAEVFVFVVDSGVAWGRLSELPVDDAAPQYRATWLVPAGDYRVTSQILGPGGQVMASVRRELHVS